MALALFIYMTLIYIYEYGSSPKWDETNGQQKGMLSWCRSLMDS